MKGTKQSPETIEKARLTRIGTKRSEETKRKMSEKSKGRKHTEHSKAILSQKAIGRKGAFKGRHHTEETKKILSELKMGKPSPLLGAKMSDENYEKHIKKCGIALNVFDVNNNLLYTFPCIAEAARQLGKNSGVICKKLQTGTKTRKEGYIFRYIQ